MDVFGALAALADDVTRDIPDETCSASCPGPLSCVVCGSAVEAGGPLTGPLPSFTYGNMVCWAAYCIPYSNFLGQYHRTYGLSHMDGLVLMCSALLIRSLPVFLYAETFKTGDGQVCWNCLLYKNASSKKN